MRLLISGDGKKLLPLDLLDRTMSVLPFEFDEATVTTLGGIGTTVRYWFKEYGLTLKVQTAAEQIRKDARNKERDFDCLLAFIPDGLSGSVIKAALEYHKPVMIVNINTHIAHLHNSDGSSKALDLMADILIYGGLTKG